jgi:hypothetical protein
MTGLVTISDKTIDVIVATKGVILSIKGCKSRDFGTATFMMMDSAPVIR